MSSKQEYIDKAERLVEKADDPFCQDPMWNMHKAQLYALFAIACALSPDDSDE